MEPYSIADCNESMQTSTGIMAVAGETGLALIVIVIEEVYLRPHFSPFYPHFESANSAQHIAYTKSQTFILILQNCSDESPTMPKPPSLPLVRLPSQATIHRFGTPPSSPRSSALLRFGEIGWTISREAKQGWAIVGDSEGRRHAVEVCFGSGG